MRSHLQGSRAISNATCMTLRMASAPFRNPSSKESCSRVSLPEVSRAHLAPSPSTSWGRDALYTFSNHPDVDLFWSLLAISWHTSEPAFECQPDVSTWVPLKRSALSTCACARVYTHAYTCASICMRARVRRCAAVQHAGARAFGCTVRAMRARHRTCVACLYVRGTCVRPSMHPCVRALCVLVRDHASGRASKRASKCARARARAGAPVRPRARACVRSVYARYGPVLPLLCVSRQISTRPSRSFGANRLSMLFAFE